MQSNSLRGQDVGVDDLADQGVAEPVRLVVDHQQLRVDGSSHRLLHGVLAEVGDSDEQLVGRLMSHRGDRDEHFACRRRRDRRCPPR